jgi:hypothetical protein
MNETRADHVQVLLNDGRVLVIGGRTLVGGNLLFVGLANTGPILATCEIYDPVMDTWTKTGRMSLSRMDHKAICLPDGRVLVVGGIGFNPTQPAAVPGGLRDAELWNPTTGAWQPAGRTAVVRNTPNIHYLPSTGQVLVVGGNVSERTELFDPVRVRWKLGASSIPFKRVGGQTVLMANDLIFAYGGLDPIPFTGDMEASLYIPNADQFLGGGLNGIFQVKQVIDPLTFTYETPNEAQYTLNDSDTAVVTPLAAPSGGTDDE